MASGISVVELITSSMRLFGGIAANETASAQEINDGLLVLNDMLENLSTEPMSVWGLSNQQVTLVANQASYTVGPTGNWNIARPQLIDDAYMVFGGVTHRVDIIDQLKYNTISEKQMAQPVVERLLYVNEFPLGVATLWPVPSQGGQLTITVNRLLTLPLQPTDTITGPPGFTNMLRYNLAVEYAPEFGMEPSPTVVQVALDAKSDYKRTNLAMTESSLDAGLLGY